MNTRLSTKGQVVLPSPIRRRLRLRSGDELDASVENGRVILTPRIRRVRASIGVDPVTGLPVLAASDKAPKLTSKQVSEILASEP